MFANLADKKATKQNNIPITQAVTTTNKCIITIDGINFDVTVYKKLHSGGDIFNCGTDMTQIFWQRHTQIYLNFMQKYKI